MKILELRMFRAVMSRLAADRGGNFGFLTALLIPVLLLIAGGAIDVARAFAEKERLQGLTDAAVMAAALKTAPADRMAAAKAMLASGFEEGETMDIDALAAVSENKDGSITLGFQGKVETYFLQLIGFASLPIEVKATAIATPGQTSNGGCIYVLGSSGQDVLINTGAKVTAPTCVVNVHSKASPAFIMNAGATINTAKFCVKGMNYIKNGGTLSNLEVGCSPAADPFAGALPEPSLPSTCTTSGAQSGTKFSLKPGMHCDTTFNGSPTVTFQPGLHIIKGRMILNSGATVVAEGVTFYFPDVNSEIRANGALTFTGTAPTAGPYKGILMFERTSNAANNTNKQQYIFNGSKGEVLEGIVYLPNRNVTYNSTTNQVNRITLVVNQMIINSANWLMEPFTGGGGSSAGAASVRLLR